MKAGQGVNGAGHGVTGAELLLLHGRTNCGIATKYPLYRVCLMSHDQYDRFGPRIAGGLNGPDDHRPAGSRMPGSS